MTRPEPRKSALSGSPIAPVVGKANIAGKASKAGDPVLTKLTIRISEDLAAEARAAFWQTSSQTSTRSLSAWVADAIADKLERDRSAFNDGRRFDPVQPGEIPTGRRS